MPFYANAPKVYSMIIQYDNSIVNKGRSTFFFFNLMYKSEKNACTVMFVIFLQDNKVQFILQRLLIKFLYLTPQVGYQIDTQPNAVCCFGKKNTQCFFYYLVSI